MDVFAVEHRLGLSLIKAKTVDDAIKKATRRFGTHAAPFTIPKDQQLEIAHAKAFGAAVI